ncbi:ABC transporter substrate-binding protein, partial [Escherichia coli]|uniref:ABC transporter substrate-binding protein n=1 Tax=Escherichia coli TaxID=562 RepID=UPI0021D8983C
AQTGSLEALWINTSRAPLDSVEVRQALAYSIDRDTIVKQLFGKVGVEKAANSLNPFILAEFSDQESFAAYKLDLTKAEGLLTGEG